MSNLNVTTIQHESGAGNNITLDDQGNVAIAGTVTADSFVTTGGGSVGGRLTGEVIAYAGASAPADWQECDGSEAATQALKDVLGVDNVPDLRGEFIRGWDNGRGVDAGRDLLSTQDDAYGSHAHSVTYRDAGSGFGSPKSCTSSGSTRAHSTSSSGSSETRPRNIALMYIIKT